MGSGCRGRSTRPCSVGPPASSRRMPAVPDPISAPLASGVGSPDYAQQFNPGFRLDPAKVALVVVDMQYASGSRHEGLGRLLKDQGREAQGTERFDRIETVLVPTIQSLLAAFRERSLRVIFLTVGSELPDYSDLPPHMRPMAEAVGNTRGRRGPASLDALAPPPHEPGLNTTTVRHVTPPGFRRP